jgi:transcriptional repressor NrdR
MPTMRCPYCGHEDSRVTDSRNAENGVRRRRECLQCSARFTTYERVQAAGALVIKRDGRREPFSREKLLRGLRTACEKRPLDAGALENLVNAIESHFHDQGLSEVPSDAIGGWAMAALRELDQIAYVRFASVYRRFADLDSLREVLNELDAGGSAPAPREQLPLLGEETLERLRERPHLIPFARSNAQGSRSANARQS